MTEDLKEDLIETQVIILKALGAILYRTPGAHGAVIDAVVHHKDYLAEKYEVEE